MATISTLLARIRVLEAKAARNELILQNLVGIGQKFCTLVKRKRPQTANMDAVLGELKKAIDEYYQAGGDIVLERASSATVDDLYASVEPLLEKREEQENQ